MNYKIPTMNDARKIVNEILAHDTSLGQAIRIVELLKNYDTDRDKTLILKAVLEYHCK
jgi:hypothetical protein